MTKCMENLENFLLQTNKNMVGLCNHRKNMRIDVCISLLY